MVPGIISLSDVGEEKVDVPNFLHVPASFKPATTVPWLVAAPAPVLIGYLGKAIVGPVTAKTSTGEIRARNVTGVAITGAAAFFSWKAALDEEVYMGVRIAAGLTGVVWSLAAIALAYSAALPDRAIRV